MNFVKTFLNWLTTREVYERYMRRVVVNGKEHRCGPSPCAFCARLSRAHVRMEAAMKEFNAAVDELFDESV